MNKFKKKNNLCSVPSHPIPFRFVPSHLRTKHDGRHLSLLLKKFQCVSSPLYQTETVFEFDFFCNQTQFRFVASKVAIDGFLFGPLDLLVFFTYMGFSSGKSFPQFKEDGKRDFLPAFVLEGGVWPIVQLVNFRFTPVRYQLLYVNFFCLLDSSFLSWLEQQQDASWKQWLKSRVLVSKQKGEGD
ncbi:protein SYM1-like [Pyrus ussuriensis x Pyrus communis]|uniref:Protein SYM1-like n=1 Tax=Pyrus ussuriensis x Pyrus communis TaxID=2448454 RepID=A0A5N5HP20_9ROSA|nr:protein SYM1-like [Pyrus ussuriensis x Pyrus communis]